MIPEIIPVVGAEDAQAAVARWRGQLVSRAQFVAHVRWVAEQLPEAHYGVNLCEDRYLFTVAFAATIYRGLTNLLPPSRVPAAVGEVASAFEPCFAIVERRDVNVPLTQYVMPNLNAVPPFDGAVPAVAARHLAAVVFTSGSTGKPCPNRKYWGDLVRGSLLAQQRFAIELGTEVIATVPPQHMYGLETSVLLPLVCGVVGNAARPFFAEDIRACLQQARSPRILVTTPVHLRTCVGAGLQWPDIEFVISATAPLSKDLAEQAEHTLRAPVLEIFGSTETGSIASRRTVSDDPWRLYESLQLERHGASAKVQGGHLHAPVALNDHVQLRDRNSFELLGRQTDLVNIAGKRASLADLNQKLLQIPGIQDGVFVPHDGDHGKVVRLTALVVAPGVAKPVLLSALSKLIDPAFMPRPLHLVDSLPRAATGKLPRAALLPLIEQLGSGP